ncbi:MAG: TonB-dependent receptor [Vicinamibacteria bacterium]|nr:TonB-dependent receptor [Vicinamibacteria bacterium]
MHNRILTPHIHAIFSRLRNGGLHKKGILLTLSLCLSLIGSFSTAEEAQVEKQEKGKSITLPMITESVTVEAKVPRDLPYSATSELKSERIEPLKPKDLTDILSNVPGTYVSTGAKNEWGVKLRGLGTNRITLLYDGIPVYEPYYNSFDVKAFAADQIDSVKVVKGASSVLYGPNAMGGVVDVLSKRPATDQLTLRLDYGTRRTYGAYAGGALSGRNVLFIGSALREASNGYNWLNDGNTEQRLNSDYERISPSGKIYFNPGNGAEVMAEVNFYKAEYGVPTATEYYRKNYWRFRDWRRLMANLGGSFPVLDGGYIKARTYYVKHYNVLDAYKDDQFADLNWESTYDNYALGAFVLGMAPLSERHHLHASASYRDDDVSTQSAVNAHWEHYEHKTLSLGLEDRFRLIEKIELMAGTNLDHLNKQNGENRTTLNPILGVKYNPREWVDLHLTLSQKSRFPSMKNLYSLPENGGNPDLREEIGTNVEIGFTFDRGWFVSGAAFHNRIRDMIESRINADFIKQNINVARARITGVELETRKAIGPFSFAASYTWLDTRNDETDERLDLVPASQLNASLRFDRASLFSITLWGVYASESSYHSNSGIVDVAPYSILNTVFERGFGKTSVFLKVENLLNNEYWTEPGWPMKARTVSTGMRFFMEGRK